MPCAEMLLRIAPPRNALKPNSPPNNTPTATSMMIMRLVINATQGSRIYDQAHDHHAGGRRGDDHALGHKCDSLGFLFFNLQLSRGAGRAPRAATSRHRAPGRAPPCPHSAPPAPERARSWPARTGAAR